MNLERIKGCFQRRGYGMQTKFTKNELDDFLNSLIESGDHYEEEVANEIWEQSSQGGQLALVEDICKTISQAQGILQAKLLELNDQINAIEKQKMDAEVVSGKKSNLVSKLQANIAALMQDKAEYEEDLRLMTVPFGIIMNIYQSKVSRGGSYRDRTAEDGFYATPGSGMEGKASDNEELKWLLYLTLIFGVMEAIIIYGKYDFLNLIVITCLGSIYLLNYFESTFIRLTMALIATSLILDVIWLFMYATIYWSPPAIGDASAQLNAYRRFIIFFTICIIILKVPLGYILFQHRNPNIQKKYSLDVGLMKIILTPDNTNPISRGLNSAIETN